MDPYLQLNGCRAALATGDIETAMRLLTERKSHLDRRKDQANTRLAQDQLPPGTAPYCCCSALCPQVLPPVLQCQLLLLQYQLPPVLQCQLLPL